MRRILSALLAALLLPAFCTGALAAPQIQIVRAFVDGGIHEAIMEYENNVFFEILAEDLARRDMDDPPIDETNYEELNRRIDGYMAEFEEHGTDNILIDADLP